MGNPQFWYDRPSGCGIAASSESARSERFSVDLAQISTLVSFGGNPSHLSPFAFPGFDNPVVRLGHPLRITGFGEPLARR